MLAARSDVECVCMCVCKFSSFSVAAHNEVAFSIRVCVCVCVCDVLILSLSFTWRTLMCPFLTTSRPFPPFTYSHRTTHAHIYIDLYLVRKETKTGETTTTHIYLSSHTHTMPSRRRPPPPVAADFYRERKFIHKFVFLLILHLSYVLLCCTCCPW